MGFGKEQMKTLISDSGKTAKQMDMGFTHGEMGTSMRENGKHAWDTEMGQISLKMEINTLDSITMGILMGLGSISGQMEIHMRVNSEMGWSMERENGKRRMRMGNWTTSMRETIKMIKRMDWESFNGKVAINTEGITQMIRDKDTERCIGLMDQSIEVIGRKEFRMD